jgi:fatty-acyl-CoA synthase
MSLETTVALARRHSLADLLRRSAARHPDRLAVTDGVRSRTYSELNADASRIANALRERGVGVGDRVALLSRNSLEYAQAIFGVARSGAVLVPINFMLGGAEVGYVLGHSASVALLAQDALTSVAHEAIATAGASEPLRARIVLGGEREAWESFSALLEHPDGSEPVIAIGPDDPAQVLYTSGTESRPKGAVLAHGALIAQYTSCIVDGGMHSSDVELHAMPLFHCAQQHCFLLPDIYLGAESLIVAAAEPGALLEAIERHGVTKFFAPPTVWIAMLRHPDFDRRDLSSLRKGYYGAAIMPVEILREMSERLPGVRLWNFYGQTEMAPVAVMLQPEDQIRKAGAAGRACLNVETRVVDRDGHDVAVGQPGEIVHRSPHAILEYLDDPEKTAEAFRDGWFHSGDLGTLDEEGYLTVVDRIKDMIKTGGENVASREVEEAIYEHDAVAEVAVIGIAHPTWIEAVAAIVVPRDGIELTAEELKTHTRARLAAFKVPKAFAFVDALPKNPSGKLLKREMREQYAHLADTISGGRAAAAPEPRAAGAER